MKGYVGGKCAGAEGEDVKMMKFGSSATHRKGHNWYTSTQSPLKTIHVTTDCGNSVNAYLFHVH